MEKVASQFTTPFFALLINGSKIDLASPDAKQAEILALRMREGSDSFFGNDVGSGISRFLIPNQIAMPRTPIQCSSWKEMTAAACDINEHSR